MLVLAKGNDSVPYKKKKRRCGNLGHVGFLGPFFLGSFQSREVFGDWDPRRFETCSYPKKKESQLPGHCWGSFFWLLGAIKVRKMGLVSRKTHHFAGDFDHGQTKSPVYSRNFRRLHRTRIPPPAGSWAPCQAREGAAFVSTSLGRFFSSSFLLLGTDRASSCVESGDLKIRFLKLRLCFLEQDMRIRGSSATLFSEVNMELEGMCFGSCDAQPNRSGDPGRGGVGGGVDREPAQWRAHLGDSNGCPFARFLEGCFLSD